MGLFSTNRPTSRFHRGLLIVQYYVDELPLLFLTRGRLSACNASLEADRLPVVLGKMRTTNCELLIKKIRRTLYGKKDLICPFTPVYGLLLVSPPPISPNPILPNAISPIPISPNPISPKPIVLLFRQIPFCAIQIRPIPFRLKQISDVYVHISEMGLG